MLFDDDAEEPGLPEDGSIDKVLIDIIDCALEKKGITKVNPNFVQYEEILTNIFVRIDQNSKEIVSAYLFQTQNMPNIRFLLALTMIHNSFFTFEKGFGNPDQRYLDTSRRIFIDLSELSGGQDTYINFILDHFGTIKRVTSDIQKDIASKNDENLSSSNFFKTLGDLIMVEYNEYLVSYALNDNIPVYLDTFKSMKTPESIFQKEFIEKYYAISGKAPTKHLIDIATLAANCYDLCNHTLCHEVIMEELNNFKDGCTPIALPDSRSGYSETLLKAGIFAGLNHFLDIYAKDHETLAQEINEKRGLINRVSLDMANLAKHFSYCWGFNALSTKDSQAFADAYSIALSNALFRQKNRYSDMQN